MTHPQSLFRVVVMSTALAGMAASALAQPQPGPRRPLSLRNLSVTGILSDGGSFVGTVSVTRFGYDPTTGLSVDGVVTGTATSAAGTVSQVNQTFTGADASLSELGLPRIPSVNTAGGAATPTPRAVPNGAEGAAVLAQPQAQQVGTQAVCDILHLDIGPISLDLLGLQLDLSQIVLDLTAVSGSGNLLGNLLCAVAGLLDPLGTLTDITNFLGALTALLQQLNTLLG